MIDAHCHLIDSKYQDSGIQRIVNEARESGVEMIANSTGLTESRKTVEIAEKINGIWVCVGVAYEPGYENLEKTKNELRKLSEHSKVIGVGEAGLNYYAGMSEELKKYQRKLFEMHLELAAELDIPIQIHNREADEEIYQIISKVQNPMSNKILLHCFSGSVEFMRQMAKIGCYFSFGGMITYRKNEALREAVRQVPDSQILLETDSPYLPPEPLRGTINTPVNVKIVAERTAEIRGIPVSELESLTTENARRLFKLP